MKYALTYQQDLGVPMVLKAELKRIYKEINYYYTYTMKKTGYILLLVCILTIFSVSAQQQSLGVFKQNECVSLLQTCADCDYVNLTSVVYPNSTLALTGNHEMTKDSFTYNYTYCDTAATGTYVYCVLGNPSNTLTSECVDFQINDRGMAVNDNTTNIAIIVTLLVIIVLGAFMTFYLDNALKFAFFLGTSLTTVFLMNLIANIAADSGASLTVVNLLWFGYNIGLYIFYALVLYVLIKLTVELKIRKNPPPTTGSPLRAARETRMKRQGRY